MTISYSIKKDKKPVNGDITYYGRVTDIIELTYLENMKFVVFKGDWVNVKTQGRGIETDDLGFTLVNFTSLLYIGQEITDEPYVLVSQAKQVFYVEDPTDLNWHIVVRTKAQDLYDLGDEDDGLFDTESHDNQQIIIGEEDDSNSVKWVRPNVLGAYVDTPPQFRHMEEASLLNSIDDEDGSD